MMSCYREACGLSGKKLLRAAGKSVTHLQASGVFNTFSCFNHSCDPSCTATFMEDNRVVVSLLRDVCEGEELTISYVDVEQDCSDRAEELAAYGFTCACARCVAEGGGGATS